MFPSDLRVNLLRDDRITVEFEDLDGVTRELAFEGEESRAVQHELDHDRGVLMVDHAEISDLPSWVAEIEREEHGGRQEVAWRRKIECGKRCRERRDLSKQGRTNTKREDVLELSRQRAKMYGVESKAVTCPPNIPCL